MKHSLKQAAALLILLFLCGCQSDLPDEQPIAEASSPIEAAPEEPSHDEPSHDEPSHDESAEPAAEELTPYTLVSDRPKRFAFDSGAENRSAEQVGEHERYGCRFSATAPFDSLALSCPSWNDNIGSLTFSLYRWGSGYLETVSADPLAEEVYTDFADNATLTFDFAEQEPGEYLILLSNGTGGVGIWKFSKSAAGTLLYADGLEVEGVFTMTISYTATPNELWLPCKSSLDLSKIVTAPPEKELSPDDPLIVLDAMPDTWVGTDALGRTLPTNAEVGDVREGKYVGLFFWTWHCEQSDNRAINVQQLMEEHPELQNDYDNPLWLNYETGAYHWNEPIYGYYNGLDRWVLRRQAEMLANSGVDVIFFDNTNGTFTWREGYLMLCEVFTEARAQGVNTPKISFLLPFSDGENTVTQLRELYLTIYREGLYQDLWFYWDGKPLILSYYGKLNRNDPIEGEIRNFFTFRPGEPTYNSARSMKNGKWTWLSVFPQAVTYRSDGSPEQMTVGVAQNWSAEAGLTAMNGSNIFGRTHTSEGYDPRPDAKLYGANFAEQFEYALTVDPDFIFITGWNEWIAGRNREWGGVENAFPDEFNDEFSRDIEPSKGDLGDNYYYQMVSFIRRYKGVRAVPAASAPKTVDLFSGQDEWADVSPRYLAYAGNTFDRDGKGYGGLTYTDTTGRNDLTMAKAARDSENLYFLCECAETLTPYEADTGWMRLYLDLIGHEEPDWNTFDFLIEPKGDGKADVSVCEGGWSWKKLGEAVYTVSENRIQLSVSRALLGIGEGGFTVNFKWSDNTALDGDVMDFYVHGDAAPGGRFQYSYTAD